jgi:hypothetical protein
VSEERDQASEVACEDLAHWLAGQPSIDAVSAKPPNVYVRVSTDALRVWVAAGFADAPSDQTVEGTDLAVVRFTEAASPRTLDQFREAAMGRAIAALLGSRGSDLLIERSPAGELPDPEPDLELAASVVVVGSALTRHAAEECAPVGGVDVRHGPLRARHGGSVSAEDVLGDVGTRHAFGAPADHEDWRDAYADALLSFALLRTGRTKRVEVDDDKLARAAEEFASILAARACPRGGGVFDEAGDDAVRELAVELDLLPTVMARAAASLEPSFLLRFARSVAERTRLARTYMPPDDPLWPVVDEAIDLALSIAGIYIPPEVWSAASRAPLGPEQPHPWAAEFGGPAGAGWAHPISMN